MIKGGRMSGKSIDLGKSKGKFDTVFISMSLKDWNKNQKKLKALEIIKNKKVCVMWLKNSLRSYNSTAALYDLPILTQEEYELLREVLL
jgi:hypothetical protein